MLADQLAAAIETAPTFKAIDDLARLTWRGLAEGHINDTAAQALGTAVEARRAAIRSRIAVSVPKGVSDSRRASRSHPRSPDRQRSIERRRRVACSGAVPGKLACHFTPGQTAVLTIVAQEVKSRGRCELPVDKIAALAGVCRTLVQDALREARRLGLITVQERRRAGLPSLTNIVGIVSPSWRAWLKLEGGGFRKTGSTQVTKKNLENSAVDHGGHALVFPVCSGQNLRHNNETLGGGSTRMTRMNRNHADDAR